MRKFDVFLLFSTVFTGFLKHWIILIFNNKYVVIAMKILWKIIVVNCLDLQSESAKGIVSRSFYIKVCKLVYFKAS